MRWKESNEARTKKLSRRKWEARARVSLSKRHAQYEELREELREENALAQRLRERRFRGRKLTKQQKLMFRRRAA